MNIHTFPFLSLFKKAVPDLGPPDEDGWAAGTCPFCGDANTFRANLKSGRWTCLPLPLAEGKPKPVGRKSLRQVAS